MSAINFSKINSTRGLTKSAFEEENNHHIYYQEINWLLHKIKVDNDYIRSTNHIYSDNLNPVDRCYSVIGERGTGKTSCLKTIKNILHEDGFYTFDIIEPNQYSEDLYIFEMVIAEILKLTQLQPHNDQCNRITIDIESRIKKISKTLSNMHISTASRSNFINDAITTEVISDIQNRTQIFDEIADLFKKVHESLAITHHNHQGIVICIDDVDLISNNAFYRMLNDIWKYLSKNVIVILAYRERQLIDTVLASKIRENQTLIRIGSVINHPLISINEIRTQAEHHLEKVLPNNNKIFLRSNNSLLQTPIHKILYPFITNDNNIEAADTFIYNGNPYNFSHFLPENIDNTTDLSVQLRQLSIIEFIEEQIDTQTRINFNPIDRVENQDLLFPSNIRNLLHFLAIIFDQPILEPNTRGDIDDH